MTDDTGAEIAAIEQTMRSNFREYANNTGMQDRYGTLIAARQAAGPDPARTDTAVDTEIAKIENRIKTDNRGYRGDKAMQARYLELLGERNTEAAAPSPAAAKHGHYHPPETKQPTAPVEPAGDGGDGHSTVRPTAEIITELETEPESAALLQRWGADADDNVAFMAREATEILNALPVEDAQELQATVDAMSPGARANLYRHLADAGRARRTR